MKHPFLPSFCGVGVMCVGALIAIPADLGYLSWPLHRIGYGVYIFGFVFWFVSMYWGFWQQAREEKAQSEKSQNKRNQVSL